MHLGVALVVLAFAVALPALAGCGGKAEETEATGGDVYGFIEFLVPVIELSKCTNLSAAAREFERNTGGNLDFQKEAKEFQRFVDAAPDDIQGDLQTFADAFSKWAEAVERAEALKGADLANPTQETLKKLQASRPGSTGRSRSGRRTTSSSGWTRTAGRRMSRVTSQE